MNLYILVHSAEENLKLLFELLLKCTRAITMD